MATGERTTGLVRSDSSAKRVRHVGAWSLRVDLDQTPEYLPLCDRLIYCAPPAPRDEADDTRLERVLRALDPHVPAHVVYLSSSGVYGNCEGQWVDETRPPAPATARARRRMAAEEKMLQWAPHAVILRVAGIYGATRLPVERVVEAQPVLGDSACCWTNRIHVDDLAALTWAAACSTWPNRIYNASDGTPTRHADFYDALAGMLQVAPPPRISWQAAPLWYSETQLSFLTQSKRLSNARLLTDTDFRFHYADYRRGIAATLLADPEFAPSYQ